jgi:hypothetical protein
MAARGRAILRGCVTNPRPGRTNVTLRCSRPANTARGAVKVELRYLRTSDDRNTLIYTARTTAAA